VDRRSDEELASPKDFARMARVSRRTIRRWMDRKQCPEPFDLNGSPRWRLGTLRQWIWEREQKKWCGANRDKAGQTRTSVPEAEKEAGRTDKRR